MGISEQDAIKELQTRDAVFVAYSQATKLPYVICDEESFNDQVWVFATEEEIKAFGKKKLEAASFQLHTSAFRYLFHAGAAPSA